MESVTFEESEMRAAVNQNLVAERLLLLLLLEKENEA